MIKALVPVDGSENACRAVRHVVTLIRGREPMEVHLLNVQAPIASWEVRSHLTDEEVASWQKTRGEEALGSARAILTEAGITFFDHVRIGDVAKTIAHFAKDREFDKIVMGTRGMGAIENLVMGSVSTKVIHLSDVPVTLVK
jgi:nucleotide-binding universal stress UspA family protein